MSKRKAIKYKSRHRNSKKQMPIHLARPASVPLPNKDLNPEPEINLLEAQEIPKTFYSLLCSDDYSFDNELDYDEHDFPESSYDDLDDKDFSSAEEVSGAEDLVLEAENTEDFEEESEEEESQTITLKVDLNKALISKSGIPKIVTFGSMKKKFIEGQSIKKTVQTPFPKYTWEDVMDEIKKKRVTADFQHLIHLIEKINPEIREFDRSKLKKTKVDDSYLNYFWTLFGY